MSNALQELQNIKQAIEQGFGVVNSYSQVLLEMASDVIQRNYTASIEGSFQTERALADIAKARASGDTTSKEIARARLQSHKPTIGDDAPLVTTTATTIAAATTNTPTLGTPAATSAMGMKNT